MKIIVKYIELFKKICYNKSVYEIISMEKLKWQIKRL